MITKELASRTLHDLGAAHDRIATAMYTVDTHAAWSRLRGGLVTGVTLHRAQELQAEVDRLWACFAALGEHLERARALNAPARLADAERADLTTLLTTPVVTLDPQGAPVEGTGPVAHRTSLENLAEQTERRCATVLAQLSDMDAAWTLVVEAYVRTSAELDQLAALAAEVGDPDAAAPARAAAAEVERLDLADPLAAAPGGMLAPATQARLDGLRERVASARRDVDGVIAARDTYAQRRRALDQAVDQLATAETDTAAVYARVVQRIARPGLAPAPGAAAVLRARLADLDDLRDAGQWRRLAGDLSTVEAGARVALARAAELSAAAEELLTRRAELRGRLDAFRAKAAALGLAEDPVLTTRYVAAHDLLYAAPCDLRAATRAVHAYATALAGPAGRRADDEEAQ